LYADPVPESEQPNGDAVLDRAFALLRAFSAERTELNLTELSRRSELPLSTTRRLAGQLVALGALERPAARRYTVGVRLWEIASLAPRGLGVRAAALPFMEDLYEVTHQHVLLAVREHDEAVLVERLSGHQAVDVLYRIGGRMPLVTTGVGLVLLAHAPQEIADAALVTASDPAALRRTLADIRRDEVTSFRPGPPWPVVSVAAPVRDRSGAVVAALSIVVPDGRGNPQALSTAVRAAARGISRSAREVAAHRQN
jgi:DNA-binding IclR family transcriptional regulator